MKTKAVLIMLCLLLMVGCERKGKDAAKIAKKPAETSRPVEEQKSGEELQPMVKGTASEGQPAVQEQESAVITGKLGDAAAALKGLEFVKGEAVEFKRGLVYVVEFWATWCPPCRTSIPHLTELQHKYKDKVTFIGISDEPVGTVKPFVEEMADKMDYTVAVDARREVSDAYMKAFGINGIPNAFLVDQQGTIVWQGHPMGDLEAVLEEVVAGTFDGKAYAKKIEEESQKRERVMTNFNTYFDKVADKTNAQEVKKIGAELLAEDIDQMLNALAWRILTEVAQEDRDLEFALQAAAKANRLTEGKNPMILDTYAQALYQSGQIAEAIQQQTKAVELSGGVPQMQEELKNTLDKYLEAMKENPRPAPESESL